ncbi:hypothetical protein WP8S18E04_02800 [Aeromonas caviae]|nr:hypothetical protein WP8S18E04_02800 [Aeromonas caviae]
MKNAARGSVFPCRIHPGSSALALPSLANKGLYRQITTATTLCTGRAASLSTCGNKPACGNARLVTNKNGARGSVFQCGINPGRSALALPSLANKGWYRQLTAATTLCTGRAASLSTCGNKPVCGNALLVTNKNGARGSDFNAVSIPDGTRFALFPLPCQQAFVPPATATTLCIGRATSHCLDPSQEKKEPHYAIEITPVSVAGSRKGSLAHPDRPLVALRFTTL